MIWILMRAVAVVAGSVLGYFQLRQDLLGVAYGARIGVAVVVIEMALRRVNLITLGLAAVGIVVGLVASRALDATILLLGSDETIRKWEQYALLVKFAMAYLGLMIAVAKAPELDTLDRDLLTLGKKSAGRVKLLDTSAIIDGRIADIVDTRFLSGTLVVPRFVVQEMHALADSADAMKRARGRRALDILARLQENPEVPVELYDRDVPDAQGVDAKLVRLAKELGCQVVTTDFNLHKVAALDDVQVLNINDLSAALKPIVLPGEGMSVFVMKEGKEKEQGVAYLDDGTMVVVEDGRRHIGKRIEVAVASILQTSAGRMIFAKAKEGKGGGHGGEKPHEKGGDKPHERGGDRPDNSGRKHNPPPDRS